MNINKIKQVKSLSVNIFGFICLSSFINAQAQPTFAESTTTIETSYLESKNELKDYILDTGDKLTIEFVNAPEISNEFTIDEQGEIYFKRIKYTYVRGLTIKELTQLLEKRYQEFLINPEIYIRISKFKPIRVSVKGEVRRPGIIKFPAFSATSFGTISSSLTENKSSLNSINNFRSSFQDSDDQVLSVNRDTTNNFIKRNNDYLTSLSNAIKDSGGLTSYSDISKLEIVRDIPIGKGGGKKKAVINFLSYIEEGDTKNDIRLFDGDSIFIPSLKEKDPTIIPKSVISGLSPRFISISVSGKIEKPGVVLIPSEGSLSDVMNLSGPRKPLSGKVFLVRYNKDGTLLRINIKYSANASPGSINNPFLLEGDLITVKNSMLGRTSGILKAITDPFVNIYATNELFKSLSGE